MCAVRTGLEPVTPCVTGMYSNQTELTHQKKRAANETRTRDPNLGKVVLYQLSYCRKPYVVWAGTDSNCRSREATDLQSARFNHLPTYPKLSLVCSF